MNLLPRVACRVFLLLAVCDAGPARAAAAAPDAAAAMIEADWRKQDGIGTPRHPATCAAAIAQLLARGDALLRDLQVAGVDLRAEQAAWDGLRAAPPGEETWRQLHRLRRQIALRNPLAAVGPLLFVKQAPGVFSHQLTQYYGRCARPGGGVFVLEEPGRSLRCRPLTAGLPPGSCQQPAVSYDGRRVLFAYCRVPAAPASWTSNPERFYHLYEMTAGGADVRQLTDGPYDDFAPRYLPDGRLVFISTRRGGFHRCGQGPCPTYTLAVANADGSQPRPISWHETHEWDPAVLNDGRIIYTRWDYVDRHAVYYEQLWSAHPDGSHVQAYYGNHTLNPVGVWEAQPIPGSPRVMATAAAHHAMTAGSIILLDITRGRDGLAPVTRLTPDALFPESEAPVAQDLAGGGRWHAPAGVAAPPPVPPEAARWPGHCYRTPWPLSEKYFLVAYSFDPLIGEPHANPPNQFGLYLADAFGNKELLYRDPDISSLWPMPLRPRPAPPMLPAAEPAEPSGTFFLQDVRAAWPYLPDVPITRLRVLQILPKTTPNINAPTLGLAHASPGKQVLGTVPVEADGSAFFRAPAGVPLAFQVLDARGQAVQTMRSAVYLQPGETAGCIGCHEPRDRAPAPRAAPRALRRPPSDIAPGPDGARPFSYPLLVQPVLDRHCVTCHSGPRPGGGLDLTGAPQGRFTASYHALAGRVPISAWGSAGGDFRAANSEPLTRPDFFGARASPLMHMLLRGHQKVRLDADDVERLATWMDANALFYGTFDPAGQAVQQHGGRIAGPKLE